MKKQICTQCKMECEPGEIRCPRCRTLLLKGCDGNCSKCKMSACSEPDGVEQKPKGTSSTNH